MDTRPEIAAKAVVLLQAGHSQRNVTETKISKGGEVHVPHLWFYKLLSFLDEKDAQCRCGTISDEESQQSVRSPASAETSQSKRKANQSDCGLDDERKKARLNDTAQEFRESRTKSNSFGVYVGEELERLNTFQRQIAEKLISEVLFLAKTENLDYNSNIETGQSRLSSLTLSAQHIVSTSPYHTSISASAQLMESQLPKSLPPQRCVSPEDPLSHSLLKTEFPSPIAPTEGDNSCNIGISPTKTMPSPPDDNYKQSDENSTSLLKELLIQK